MKRILIILTAITLIGSGLLHAQQTTKTIKGVVIDPDGNPVPGAEVRATNGADVITTDSDGTYEMEVPFYLSSITVSYPGYKMRKTMLDSAPYYVTQFKPSGGRKGLCGFVEIVGAPTIAVGDGWFYEDEVQGHVGLMGGATYNGWGGYAKFMLRVGGKVFNEYWMNDPDHSTIGSPGLMPVATVGFMRQFSNVFGLFLGTGLGTNAYGYQETFVDRDANGNREYKYTATVKNQIKPVVELGATFNFNKHFNCVFGLTYILPKGHADYIYTANYDFNGSGNQGWLSPFFGLGYTFTPKK